MNANTKGVISVKSNRINERVDEFTERFLNQDENQESISRENFKSYVKGIHIIVSTELTEKGVERKWKK